MNLNIWGDFQFCISVPLTDRFVFWTDFAEKGYFPSKAGQMNINIEFSLFELV